MRRPHEECNTNHRRHLGEGELPKDHSKVWKPCEDWAVIVISQGG